MNDSALSVFPMIYEHINNIELDDITAKQHRDLMNDFKCLETIGVDSGVCWRASFVGAIMVLNSLNYMDTEKFNEFMEILNMGL